MPHSQTPGPRPGGRERAELSAGSRFQLPSAATRADSRMGRSNSERTRRSRPEGEAHATGKPCGMAQGSLGSRARSCGFHCFAPSW